MSDIRLVKLDIFQSQAEVIVNPVNTVGVMGKGLALQFKERYPENFEAYVNACRDGVNVGEMMCFVERGQKIVNFPTKQDWRNPSEMSYIEDGLDTLVTVIKRNQIKSIAMPLLGCGLGGLDGKVVFELIERKLGECDCVVLVCVV